MDAPVFETKYKKYKNTVKEWENSFKEKNGRVPSKVKKKESMRIMNDCLTLQLTHKNISSLKL